MTMTYEEARAALAAKTLAERDLARLGTCPPWRHAVFAALETALVASPLVPMAARFAILAGLFLGIFLIVRSDRRRLGVFINGYRRGRTRLVVLPILLGVLGMYTLSFVAVLDWHKPWISVVCACVTFPACYLGSVVWQQVFRRELGL
jgi:hypothetical protein